MPIQSSTAGIPLAAHSPLSSHRHATDSNASIHHETSGRVGMSTLGSSHGRMQPLDNNSISARRWHRLQRRSPLDSASGSQSHSHHSPRGARLLSSVASTTGHIHLTSRERQYQTRRDRLSIGDHREHDPSSSASSSSILYQPHPSRLRGLSNMADPPQSALPTSSSALSDIASESQQQQQQQGMLMPMEGSTPADSLVSFITSERATDLARQHGTHSSTRTLSSVSSSTPRSWSSSFQTERSSRNIPTLTSTPMERTFTNNPAMSSASNIAAATAEPTAIVISVASSSPGGSALSGASPPTTQMESLSTMTDFMRNQTSREQSHARSDETASIQRDGDFTSLDLHHRSTEPLSSTRQQHSLPDRREPDDRINFRLLGNVYFSTWARQSLGDADNDYNMDPQSESEVQPRDPHTDRVVAMMGDDRAEADEIMSENEGDGFGPSQSLRQRVTHESNREEHGRFGYEESSGDEIDDDGDDGIDLVIEERRRRGTNSAGTSDEPGSPSTPAPSHLERPQHAQLSPRSAAVLTSVLSTRRSLWSQPITNSSLTPSLLAQARQHARQYEGNPNYRRTPFPLNLQTPSSLSRPDLRSLGGRVYLSHEAQRAADSECLVDAESGLDPWLIEPGSVSTQYETIQYACGGLDLRNHLVDPNSCSENGFTRDLRRQDVWPLKFDMYFADGGEFNASHSVENVLKNDSSVYCSRRSTNINICLRIAEPHRTFVLTQLRAKAPTSGFTAPCKEGLVFISHEPISLDKTAFFNNMTKERYDEYIESNNQRTRAGEPLHPENDVVMQPAAFFQLNGLDDSCTLDFTPNRSGRYVVIKLLRSRCTNSLQTPENIDLQYLGLIGYTGSRSFASAALL